LLGPLLRAGIDATLSSHSFTPPADTYTYTRYTRRLPSKQLDILGRNWSLVLLYVAYGLGRGIWESPIRAVFNEVFDDSQKEAAFANLLVPNLVTMAFFSYFNAYTAIETQQLVMQVTIYISSAAVVPCLLVSRRLLQASRGKGEADVSLRQQLLQE
jgi:hypothetical protein